MMGIDPPLANAFRPDPSCFVLPSGDGVGLRAQGLGCRAYGLGKGSGVRHEGKEKKRETTSLLGLYRGYVGLIWGFHSHKKGLSGTV